MLADPAPGDLDAWVRRLADPLRSANATRHLLAAGDDARPAIIRGLASRQAAVRRHCARLLDHLADVSAYPALIALMGDDDAGVRMDAIHALACDRCKSDACRPDDADVLPPALTVLRDDPDPHVRAHAAALVGRFAHRQRDAAEALQRSAAADPSPAVRKVARWHAPGGTIYERTRPRPARAH